MKDIERNTPVRFADQVEFNDQHVVFKPICVTKHGEALLVAAKAGQNIPEHSVDAMAIATVVEGAVDFTVEGTVHAMNAGDSIVLAPGTKHSLHAKDDFKIYLAKINA